ncbi:integral membrane sensor signal transduction histidine kinase [Anaeromyxobacter sp. Fw109-5]|nr:integral membrane sensor signal transduction histidine kinase [Anaeromyxobacter sp. Fw109-5]
MRRRARGRIFSGRNEVPSMPPPPGHREIQHEELSRLFGRMTGVRLAALPPIGALALWLAWIEPAPWRRVALVVALVGMCAFFVGEWIGFRRRGFTPGAVPRNLIIATVWQMGITAVTGGLASPFLYIAVPLGMIGGVFLPWRASLLLSTVQAAAVFGLAALGASGAFAELNLQVFGGGPRIGPPAFLYTHAAMLSLVFLFSSGAGRATRWSFDRMIRRALAAQQASLEAHAERAEELTALSAEIAHELKNPLASVKGLAGLLAPGLPEGKAVERLQVLRREVDRMQAILDEFLNFSRPLVPLALGDAELGGLCAEVAALHEGMARERDVAIVVRAEGVSARCDPRKVKQILINLVQNALDASPARAQVEVEASLDPGGGARVRVLDRGRGVDPSLADALFSPGATTKPRGSGLGLTIARALARQHGGELVLAPRPGGGTAAELVLPARPEDAGGGRAA